MKLRIINAIIATSAILTAPVLSQADNAPAFDSCVKAFVASLSTKFASAPKLREAQFLDSGLGGSQSDELMMTAIDPRDNHRVARAVCRVNAEGEVLSLQDQTLDAPSL